MSFAIFTSLTLLIVRLRDSSSLKCYECTGYIPCGNGQTHLLVNCAGKCMVYQNQYDGNVIVRRCCWDHCGESLSFYEGRLTYFCSEDSCNGQSADLNFIEGGSGDEPESTMGSSPLSSSPSSTVTSTKRVKSRFSKTSKASKSSHTLAVPPSLICYECTGHYSKCGLTRNAVLHNCRMCMVYFNAFDSNTVVRRCCTTNCGRPGSIQNYEGRQTYFCSSNLCNGAGAESMLMDAREIPFMSP